jgi:hypothetical protein
MSLSLPYKTQVVAGGTNYAVNVVPTYSSLTMSAENNQRKPIIQSLTLASDLSYQRNASWISAYKLEMNQDNSFLTSLDDDDQTSLRGTLGTTQTKLLDSKAQRTLAGDLNLALNKAKGKNNSYQKAILGCTYSAPYKFESQASLRAEITSVTYPDSSTSRQDTSYSLSAGASKNLKKNLSLALSIQYVNNASNVDANKYDKFVLTTLLTYSGSLINDGPAENKKP